MNEKFFIHFASTLAVLSITDAMLRLQQWTPSIQNINNANILVLFLFVIDESMNISLNSIIDGGVRAF